MRAVDLCAHVCGSHRYHTKQGTSKNVLPLNSFRLLVLVPPARAEHSGRYNLRDARPLSPGFDFPRQLFYLRTPLPFDGRHLLRHEFARRKKREKSMGFLIQYVVFHHTDTHVYILSLALALSIHNKQQSSPLPTVDSGDGEDESDLGIGHSVRSQTLWSRHTDTTCVTCEGMSDVWEWMLSETPRSTSTGRRIVLGEDKTYI
jgi:hypothetical protein